MLAKIAMLMLHYNTTIIIILDVQAFTRLQKLMVSLSHSGLITLMDNIAVGHDEEVLKWKDKISLTLSQCSRSEVIVIIMVISIIFFINFAQTNRC